MKKLTIIVPVYNEKDTLLEILEKISKVKLPNEIDKQIILIDDFSTDGTREILKKIEKKYSVYYHDKNYGKGMAIRTGMKYVKGDFVLIQDADLEYEPQDYIPMIEYLIDNELEVLYGSRIKVNKNSKSYWTFYLGGQLLTVISNLLYKQKLTDEPTCYKLIKTSVLKSLDLECVGFEFCPEVTAKLSRLGFNIQEIPIIYYPRSFEQGKKINRRDGIIGIWTLFKYINRNPKNDISRQGSFGESKLSLLDKIIYKKRYNKVLNQLDFDKKIVADTGCGFNPLFLTILQDRIKKGYAIDYHLNKSNLYKNIEYIESNIESRIPLADNTIDIVTSLEVLEHLTNPNNYLIEINRILKKGGFLIMTVPTKFSKPVLEILSFKLNLISKEEILDHKIYYNKEDLIEILVISGFKKANITHKYFAFGMNNLIIAKN